MTTTVTPATQQEILGGVKSSLLITDDDIKLFSEFTKSFNRNDATSKDIYTLINKLYRTTEKNSVTLHLGRLFNVVSNGNDKVVEKLKGIAKLAKASVDLKVILKIEDSFYYNIEGSVKLFVAIEKANKLTMIDDLKDCRKVLKECYNEADTMAVYNNKLNKVIKDLRAKYGIIDIDGISVVSDIKKKVSKLSNTEKEELISFLQSSLS